MLAAVVVHHIPQAVGPPSAIAAKQYGSSTDDAVPAEGMPETKVSVGSAQLSSGLLQDVPLVGALAVENTPCARPIASYDVAI